MADDDAGSQWSVVQFVKYRMEPIQDQRADEKDILTYNFDDVLLLASWKSGYGNIPTLTNPRIRGSIFNLIRKKLPL